MIELFFKYMGHHDWLRLYMETVFYIPFHKNIMEVILHVPRQVSHLVRLV